MSTSDGFNRAEVTNSSSSGPEFSTADVGYLQSSTGKDLNFVFSLRRIRREHIGRTLSLTTVPIATINGTSGSEALELQGRAAAIHSTRKVATTGSSALRVPIS